MERNIFEKQRDLNDRLNRYRDEYYNHNAPSVSDEVYDRLFDELKELEQETGDADAQTGWLDCKADL